jgi:2-oxoglutarate dehydrogenase E1 component
LPEDSNLHPDIVKLLKNYPDLDLSPFGLDSIPLDEQFYIGPEVRSMPEKTMYSIRDIVTTFRRFYCGNVGVEISHLENTTQREWLLRAIGSDYGPYNWSASRSKADKMGIFQRLLECDHTAKFFGKKFPSAKVFGIEGCESLVPGLWSVLETSSSLGVEGIEMGMAHRYEIEGQMQYAKLLLLCRGRMNILHNVFRIPLKSICKITSSC